MIPSGVAPDEVVIKIAFGKLESIVVDHVGTALPVLEQIPAFQDIPDILRAIVVGQVEVIVDLPPAIQVLLDLTELLFGHRHPRHVHLETRSRFLPQVEIQRTTQEGRILETAIPLSNTVLAIDGRPMAIGQSNVGVADFQRTRINEHQHLDKPLPRANPGSRSSATRRHIRPDWSSRRSRGP